MTKIQINESQYAYVLAQTALLNAEISGMNAENSHRLHCGMDIVYGDEAFGECTARYEDRIGHDAFLAWSEENAKS